MRRTNIYLDDATLAEIRSIRDRFRLASNTAAVRMAIREYAATLVKQDAADRRRAEQGSKEQGS